jgi:transcription antitermination factor NusG
MRKVSDNPPARFPKRPIGEAEFPWFVAHVKPRQEKAAADDCLRLSVEYYLPMFTSITRRKDNNKPRKSVLPLFPGYLSIAGTKETARALYATGRIAHIIEIKHQQKFIGELSRIYNLLESGVRLEPCSVSYRSGDEVVIRNGPFRGIRGIIMSVRNQNRLLLSVNGLGLAMTTVDASAVAHVDKKEDAPS